MTKTSYLILALMVLAVLPSDAALARGRYFQLFDAMLFSGQPSFSEYGFKHLRIVDDHELYKAGESAANVPSVEQIKKVAEGGAGPGGIVVIDLEQWSMTAAPDVVASSRQKYIETLDRFHTASSNIKVGLYDVLPGRDYWRAMGPRGGAAYRSWEHQIDVAQPIVAHVDALFPSLYTFYSDQAGWVRYATENLRQARRIAAGKPVYCFLWPQYHDSSDTPFALLSGDYWRLQLDTCRKLADGVVIWGGYTTKNGFTPLPWDASAPWWKETVSFARSLRH
jgi:hypothetical protein